MMAPHAGLERRVLAALEASPPRIPVVLGGCGTGRTTALHALVDRLGREQCQYIDVERAASTPERFFGAVVVRVAVCAAVRVRARRARRARRSSHTLAYFNRARADDRPATFLLDEVLELRTFESFPGLRHVLRELVQALSESGNRFVLTSRYVVARASAAARRRGALRSDPPAAALDHRSVGDGAADGRHAGGGSRGLSRTIQALSDGRASYVRAHQRSRPRRRRPRRRSDLRAHGAAHVRRRRSPRGAAIATSCGCTARAATARSRRFSRSSRTKSR